MANDNQVLAIWREAKAGVEIRPSDPPKGLALKLTQEPGPFLAAAADGAIIGIAIGTWDGCRGGYITG